MHNLRKVIFGVCFVACDDREAVRLMNICSHKNIRTWCKNGEKRSGFYIYGDDRDSIIAISEECMLSADVSNANGMVSAIKNNKKRVSVIVGLLLFGLLIYWESLYIWHVDVDGCDKYTRDEVLYLLESEYPCYGVKKNRIKMEALKKTLTDNLSEVCWASCSVSGTKLKISLKESVDVFENTDTGTPCNMVSSMDCTVSSIVVASGTPVAVAGDSVKKGDILISGIVNICNDDSEIVDTRQVPANGTVYGISKLQYSDTVKYEYYKKQHTDKKLGAVEVRLGRYIITPYQDNKVYENCDQESDEHLLHIGDFYLPLGITVKRNLMYDIDYAKYTEDQAKKIAEQRLMTYIGNLQEKGVQIVEKNVIITNESDGVSADGSLTVSLSVGVPDSIK